ncbi:MAG: oligoendopeptidase F [candidate division Zixibacteria bacterium]|nr:oligoendopeptidase F [candidate division Zixibacteria bacterium]
MNRPLTLTGFGYVLFGLLLVFLLGATILLAQTKAVQKRSEIAEKDKWDLTSLYASKEAWEKEYSSLEASLTKFDAYKGTLKNSPSQLVGVLKLNDSLGLVMSNLYVYANLKFDEDQQVSEAQEMSDRVSGLYSRFGQATSFIVPEILSLSGDQLQTFLKSTPELDVYRFYLEDIARQRAHILSEREEELLAMAGPVTSSPQQIFEMINNADISYGTIKDETGQEVELTKERYYALLESPDRRVRRDANHAFNSGYLEHVNTLAATLAGSVKSDYFQMKARGYNTCLEMALDADNIPPSVYHNLVDAVNANLAPLHKWAAVRKRILGVDTLYNYDMSAPLLPGKAKEYTYDEAKQKIIAGLAPMGKKYLADFEKGLNSRWVDVYENDGKRSGAYNWGTHSSHPHILLNFNGTLDAVFTLAHEMGHGMHSFYTNLHEPVIYGDHYIFTAEVASTCNEAVLMKYLLEKTSDKTEKLRLLIHYIDQIIGTFYTQVSFSEFELAIHDRVEKGGALSADFLRKTWRDINQRYYGPELVIDSVNDLTGIRIPHFYNEYYVYQYATCYAAAQALSQKILKKEKGALETYHRFLGTGTSKYPVDILKDAGVDMTTSQPVDATIKVFSDLVNEVERLLNSK